MRNLKGAIGLAAVATLALSCCARRGAGRRVARHLLHPRGPGDRVLAGRPLGHDRRRWRTRATTSSPSTARMPTCSWSCSVTASPRAWTASSSSPRMARSLSRSSRKPTRLTSPSASSTARRRAKMALPSWSRRTTSTIARDAVQYIYEVAMEMGKESVTPLIMVGDLGDPNAVGRYQGFYDVIDSDPEFFGEPIEVADQLGRRHRAGRPAGGPRCQPRRRLPVHLVRLPLPDHRDRVREAGQVGHP